MSEEPNELNLAEVVELPVEDINDDHKAFLEEHKEELTPEQAEKFGITVEKKEEEEDEPIDVNAINPEVRSTPKEKGEGEEEEEDETEKLVRSKVDETIRPIKDKQEVDDYVRDNPQFAKYAPVILKYMQNPAYSNIPVKNIAPMVAANDLLKMGARMEREAQKKVAETKDGGQQVRKPSGGAKIDWSTASKDEFAAQKAKVLGQRV